MAVSAFKSSTKRSTPTSNSATPLSSSSASASVGRQQNTDNKDNPTKKDPLIRRSRSVSAFSRTSLEPGRPSSENFLNKRDNPLFWSTDSQTVDPQNPVKPAKFDDTRTKESRPVTSTGVDTRRGRSGLRNADVLGTKKVVGRSLSRVDPGRCNRSVSRGPDSRGQFVSSKSEDERECGSLKKVGSDGKNGDLVRSSSGVLDDQSKGLKTWSSQHSYGSDADLSSFHLQSTNWGDGVSVASSLSGAEGKTIKAVYEQMNMNYEHPSDDLLVQGNHLEGDTKTSSIYETVRSEVRRAISEIQTDLESVMHRSNTSPLETADIADIPPDLVNPSAIELVLDIRREYAKKLEQSQERARKLQSDLAVEEHRGQELSRILKEVLPDPKTSNLPKSRPGRKASIERRKMSKRLSEEAMAYFDECVSLSTFDSSDFSSPEDPPLNLVGFTTPVGKSISVHQGCSSASDTNNSKCYLNHKQLVQGNHLEGDTKTSSIYETVRSEVRRAISEIQTDLESVMHRSNTSPLETADIADIPPDLVNPSAIELVLDIRREYAKKLEQSQERARKLQSDLAVEEHRGQELSRILKEVLPDPKTSNLPKSRPGRKASIERRKMSKRLSEEAMAYFDECVSLSTFDSSDFSSPEDPPLNLVGFTTPVGKSISVHQGCSSASDTNNSKCYLNHKQDLSIEDWSTNDRHPSGLMASTGPREPAMNPISPNSAIKAQDCKFSFAQKPQETLELQQDIRKYVVNCERDDMDLKIARSNYYDLGEYDLHAAAQSYMFNRVLFKNRIESGSTLLCGGGISSPFSPFASFV